MAYRRALIIRFGGIGDILLATPLVRALHRAFPEMEVDFVVGSGMTDALAGNPLIRRIYTFDKRKADAQWSYFGPFLREMARQRYDLVVNLHPSVKSILMGVAAGARRQLFFRKHMEVRPDTGFVAHAVDDFTKELRPLGIKSVTDRRLDFFVPQESREKVNALLQAFGVLENDSVLVINPAASRPLNRWPKERFQEVAAHFARLPHMHVFVTGAPSSFELVMDGHDEVALAREVASADSRIRSVAGQLSVKEFGALLARADALLTCDTGPMHIGAALETPLVVLSGAADPHRTGPLTANATVLIDQTLSCVPCRDRVCARGDFQCMQNLTVPNVITAIEARLEQQRRIKRGVALPIIA